MALKEKPMRDIERRPTTSLANQTWWKQRTPLEKIGAVALAVAGGAVVAVILFPHVAAAAAGGALTATGGLLLKKAFGK
jgi:hypothetical protein